jgi:uncharacterized protein (DUF2062 family)
MALNLKKRIRNIYIKLIKQTGSPDFVARGVAIGFFIGFLIPMGGQTIVALPLAWLLKAKKIPAVACTWVTNPWTVIFIYPIQCFVGAKVMGKPLSFHQINNILGEFMKQRTWESFNQLGSDIMIPFLLGGALFGIIAGAISYFTTYGIITSHRNRIESRLTKRLAAQAVWESNLRNRKKSTSEEAE